MTVGSTLEDRLSLYFDLNGAALHKSNRPRLGSPGVVGIPTEEIVAQAQKSYCEPATVRP